MNNFFEEILCMYTGYASRGHMPVQREMNRLKSNPNTRALLHGKMGKDKATKRKKSFGNAHKVNIGMHTCVVDRNFTLKIFYRCFCWHFILLLIEYCFLCEQH